MRCASEAFRKAQGERLLDARRTQADTGEAPDGRLFHEPVQFCEHAERDNFPKLVRALFSLVIVHRCRLFSSECYPTRYPTIRAQNYLEYNEI